MQTFVRRSLGLVNRIRISHLSKVVRFANYSTIEGQASKCLTEIIENIMKPLKNEKYGHEGGRILNKDNLEKFVEVYKSASMEERKHILLSLFRKYGCNQELIHKQCDTLAKAYKDDKGISTLLRSEQNLNQLLKPPYHTFLTQLGSLNDGVKFLIDMRYDAITEARRDDVTREDADVILHLSHHIKEILSIWFSVGLLQLRRITWETPANILEKLAKYEAVHTVRNWMDLKHRLGPNRRCYSFFHGNMPYEPVIVLHIALTQEISDSVTKILNYRDDEIVPDSMDAKCAIFYSITSTQKGLQGIELGAYLIQAVVDQLKSELPGLDKFSSLSPIPGFRKWLLSVISEGSLLNHLDTNDIKNLNHAMSLAGVDNLDFFLKELVTNPKEICNKDRTSYIKGPLMRLCAVYICVIKRRGYALDPVTNFHLKNGATVWRINWMADESVSGLQQSCGLMVNYRYFLDEMAENSSNYITKKIVFTSDQVKTLLPVVGVLQSYL